MAMDPAEDGGSGFPRVAHGLIEKRDTASTANGKPGLVQFALPFVNYD